jgi:hypothetical protein
MVAAYPPRIDTQPIKRDHIDPIWARHWNLMQDEVRATQLTVGVNPHIATANPAERTPNYGTVTDRIQHVARGEPMCSYRGRALSIQVKPNQHVRSELTATEDTHGAATPTGYRLPETGYWVMHAKADWPSTVTTQAHPTVRALGIEVNAADIGLTDSVIETTANKDNLTTQVTWQERLLKGTDISVNLRAANGDPDLTVMPANVYLRVYLVRCMAQGGVVGLPTVGFPTPPEEPPTTPPPGTHPWPPQIEPPCAPAPPGQFYSASVSDLFAAGDTGPHLASLGWY